MSLDPGDGRRSASPPSTGRSSPAPYAPRRVEDGLPQKDKVVRRYATAIERALSSFESAQQEWADYIAFLARLLKAIHPPPPNLEYLPHASAIALRLAQCLNPALPSGVHQKALDVHVTIFSFLPQTSLGQSLHVYLPGLLPVLSFASLSVRPIFYSIFEDHILKLDSVHLRPATKSLILSLLPGVEDETSEDFERAFRILDTLRKSSIRQSHHDSADDDDDDGKDGYFWQCFFLAVITNPSRRQGALAYLTRQLPTFASSKSLSSSSKGHVSDPSPLSKAAQAAITPEPGLLVRCFAAGLHDSQMLVQRGFLDLLVTHLPLHSPVFQHHVQQSDMVLITTAAASCVLRRDMSLNRRLWSWFLGPDPSASDADDGQLLSPTDSRNTASHKQALYFQSYGALALEKSIMKMLTNNATNPSDRARPFRVCLSLMDRWEVGGLIVPKILLPALQGAFEYSLVSSPAQIDEVVRSASLFFDGVESSLIWSRLVSVLLSAISMRQTATKEAEKGLDFLHFVIDRFDIRDDEMLLRHMPNTLAILFARLASVLREDEAFSERLMQLILSLASRLLRILPPRAFDNDVKDKTGELKWRHEECTAVVDLLVQQYTQDFDESTLDRQTSDRHSIAEYILQSLLDVLKTALASTRLSTQLGSITDSVVSIITRIPDSAAFKSAALHESFKDSLHRETLLPQSAPEQSSFLIASSIMAVIVASCSGQKARYFSHEQIMDLQTDLLNRIWYHLSPFRPKYHVEAVRLIWQLETLTKAEHQVEARLAILVSEQAEEDGSEVASRFTVLWEHTMQSFGARSEGSTGRPKSRRPSVMPTQNDVGSDVDPEKVLTRPLLLILDSLNSEGTGAADVVRSWLQSLASLDRVFYILCSKLQSDMDVFLQKASETDARHRTRRNADQKLDGILFCLQHLRNLLRYPNEHIWVTLSDLHLGRTPAIELLVSMCLKSLDLQAQPSSPSLQHAALTILQTLLDFPDATMLKQSGIADALIATLIKSLEGSIGALQTVYLQTISKALKLRATNKETRSASLRSPITSERPPIAVEVPEKAVTSHSTLFPPPPELLRCLRTGLSCPSSRLFLEHWIDFLDQVLPLYADAVFANLLPLIECMCKQVADAFRYVKYISDAKHEKIKAVPISTLTALLHGLELVLAHVHRQYESEEIVSPTLKSPEQPQGFFGNMVSGVFNQDGQQALPSKTSRTNSRLTMILSFQDAVRICFSIWAWASNESGRSDVTCAATTSLNALKLRNRTRKILENLFAVEELECLETLALVWSRPKAGQELESAAVFSLLLVLDGSSPKNTVPVILNALYSRTNIDVLDIGRRSSLTSDLSTAEVASFLLSYTRAIEDDATDEIWTECMSFLRDVLSNPLPHRQILPFLLQFSALLAEKIDNTNFGELRKMRRELGDTFLRLLTATFTARPLTNTLEAPASGGANDLISSVLYVTPKLHIILQSSDRVQNAINSISSNVITPAIHAKAFPENISKDILQLFEYVAQQGPASKSWKKDISDAFNNPRLLMCTPDLIDGGWYPVIRKWALSDKDRIIELLSRITAPSTAGIMFGVGANAARLEADRRTQMVLRKTTLLLLACQEDTFVNNLGQILEKVVDLCAADPSSSPSSTTRADVFMLLRAIVLSFSPIQLSSVWPVLNSTLQKAITTCLPGSHDQETYSNLSLLQACKLLDLLTTMTPDDFQLHEWLYITDTIDAVYRPVDLNPVALTDEAAEALGMDNSEFSNFAAPNVHATPVDSDNSTRKPFLGSAVMDGADTKAMARDDFLRSVLHPFFSQLSMFAYEATYGMGMPDMETCRRNLLEDVLDESTMA